MRNAVTLGIRKITTSITKVMLQNELNLRNGSLIICSHWTQVHCLSQPLPVLPYTKTTVKAQGQEFLRAFSSCLLAWMAAGQIPSIGKALQHYSTKLCSLEHFHRPSQHIPAHATHTCYNTALPRLLQTLETGRTRSDCLLGPHRTQWQHLLYNVGWPMSLPLF